MPAATKTLGWRPNRFQLAALCTYGDGDHRYIAENRYAPEWRDESEFDRWCASELGDTLLLYIMRELGNLNADDNEEAVRLMRRSITDIESVIPAVSLC